MYSRLDTSVVRANPPRVVVADLISRQEEQAQQTVPGCSSDKQKSAAMSSSTPKHQHSKRRIEIRNSVATPVLSLVVGGKKAPIAIVPKQQQQHQAISASTVAAESQQQLQQQQLQPASLPAGAAFTSHAVDPALDAAGVSFVSAQNDHADDDDDDDDGAAAAHDRGDCEQSASHSVHFVWPFPLRADNNNNNASANDDVSGTSNININNIVDTAERRKSGAGMIKSFRQQRSKKSIDGLEKSMSEKRKKLDVRAGIAEALYGRLIQTTDTESGHSRPAKTVVRPSQVAKLTAGWVAATQAGGNAQAVSLIEYLQDENARIEGEAEARRAKLRDEEEAAEAALMLSPIRRAAREDFAGMREEQKKEREQTSRVASALSRTRQSPRKITTGAGDFDDASSAFNKQFLLEKNQSRQAGEAQVQWQAQPQQPPEPLPIDVAILVARQGGVGEESGRDAQFRFFVAHNRLPPMPVGRTRLSLLLATRLQNFAPAG